MSVPSIITSYKHINQSEEPMCSCAASNRALGITVSSGSDLRRAIALARHRAPKRCTRRVIFSAPWSTHKQTPESGCKDTYNTSVIHVDSHHTGSSPLSKICTRYTCFCYPFSRPICRQVALSSYSICNADCHWSSPLSLASS